MEIKYNDKPIQYEEFLSPSKVQSVPQVKIEDIGYKYYTLIMYDPDAVGGTHWHWIVSNVTSGNINKNNNNKNLLEYKGPSPPDDKIHRYIFELYGKNQNFKPDKKEFQRNTPLKEGKQLLQLDGNPILQGLFLSRREKGGRTKNRNTYKKGTKKTRKARKTRKRRI